MKPDFNISLLKGKVQPDMKLAALNPSYFAIDDRDTKRLLSYCADVASVLDYYNLDGEKNGNWETLLTADVSVLTARIAQYDAAGKYNQSLDFLKAFKSSYSGYDKSHFGQKYFHLGFEVVLQIDAWYKLSAQNFSDSEMTTYISNEISTTGCQLLEDFYGCYLALSEDAHLFRNEILKPFSGLDKNWSFNAFPESSVNRSANLLQLMDSASQYGRMLFNWLEEIIAEANEEYDRSLQRNDIPPHLGLIITFLDIFKYQQEAINSITERHLDFYFKDILRGQKKKATPDKTIVTFELAKGQDKLIIPRGTMLDAGKSQAGQPIVFSNDSDQVVTSSQISEYYTLTFPPSGPITIGTVTDFNKPGNKEWPLLGAVDSTDNLTTDVATLGFAFSCPDLLLSQSSRKLTLTFVMKEKLDPQLTKVGSKLLSINLTSPNGWFAAEIDSVTCEGCELSIVFSLKPGDPAIIAYSEKLHGEGFDTQWPVCKATLTSTSMPLYSLLKTLSFSSLQVTANVKGSTGFLVENNSGKLPVNLPFYPFTTNSAGGSLFIGGQEFFVKQLTDITINITWDGLPESFAQYYDAYNKYYQSNSSKSYFLNQSFAANIFVLNDRNWVPAVSQPPPGVEITQFNLFTDDGNNTANDTPKESDIVANGTKSIKLQFAKVNDKTVPLPNNANLPSFTSINSSLPEGFFCLTICAPSNGFGVTDYPVIVSSVTLANSEAIMHNSRLFVFHKCPLQEMPNIPFVPKIKSLEIDYNSYQEYQPGRSPALKWYHLHPFGMNAVSLSSATPSLLPDYSWPAYVFLGIDKLVPGTELSLCFVLSNRAKTILKSDSADVAYEYLTAEGWQSLQVISDTTDGFQRTGILRVTTPSDASCDGGQMPGKLYWIRFSKPVPADTAVRFLSTQAIEVNREITPSEQLAPVPAGSITKFVNSFPGIQSILQPIESYGASAKQTEDDFRISMAGRLRDKGRIMSVSAIESSILDQFPEIFKLVAIPLGYTDRSRAGTVKVVVTPFTLLSQANNYIPFASVDLMENVLNYLQAVGMSSVQYEISNPDFCEVTVNCHVTFTTSNEDEALSKRLNSDLQNFLSPWIKDNPVKATLITSDLRSKLYQFVKSLPYVKLINDFTCTPEIVNQSPQALLISAKQHLINRIVKVANGPKEELSNEMRIGESFFITK